MIIKYDAEISNAAIEQNLKRLTNQIYKLLPAREEELDWERSLSNLMEELAGIASLLKNNQEIIFQLMSKLEGLFSLKEKEDFPIYRRTIFESLSLIGELVRLCQD